jgi:hypothetical protein
MKTFVSVIILTVAFLSAGAFANAKQAQPAKANITIVFKNQASPEKDQSRIDACAMARCIEV